MLLGWRNNIDSLGCLAGKYSESERAESLDKYENMYIIK